MSENTPQLHVLLIPSWYPTKDQPQRGIFFKEQAQALQEAGVRVGVVYTELRSLRALRLRSLRDYHFQITVEFEDGIHTARFNAWNLPHHRLRGQLFVKSILRLLDHYQRRFGRPHLLHAHSALWGGVAAREASRRLAIPYVITEHSTGYAQGMIQPWHHSYLRAVFGDARRVIAVSTGMMRRIEPFVGGRPVDIIPNSVDTSFFTLPPQPRERTPFRFVTVAFLKPKKGIDVLLRAFARAFEGRDDVILEIGGDGPQRQELESLADALGLREKVQFLGLLNRHQVREALWRANAFVLPSRFETFGVVLIEAMATGLPVVATRCGGPEDFVHPEVGVIVEPEDVEALGGALRQVRDRYKDPEAHAANIRHYVMQQFSKESVAARLRQLYSEVLADG